MLKIRKKAMPFEIKGIFIYRVNHHIFMRAQSKTTEGMTMENGPYFMVEQSINLVDLGRHILTTFAECKIGIPHPKDLTKLSVLEKDDPYSTSEEAKLLKKLKKTEKDLRLGIKFDGIQYQFIPYKVRNKHGATPLYAKKLLSDGNPENLGRTLLEAFNLCE